MPARPQVDLYNRLYRERIVFLGQQISDDIANQIIGVMLYLDSEVRTSHPASEHVWRLCPVSLHPEALAPDGTQDNSKPMYMYINSPGGSVTAGFAMFDTMRHVKADVSTINVGLAASMGSLLLVGGAKGKRLCLPHSRVMIHQPSMGGIQGQASDIKVEAEMILGIRERVVRSLLASTPPPRISSALASAHRRATLVAHSDAGPVTPARSSAPPPLPPRDVNQSPCRPSPLTPAPLPASRSPTTRS